jgi:hypothetical protein
VWRLSSAGPELEVGPGDHQPWRDGWGTTRGRRTATIAVVAVVAAELGALVVVVAPVAAVPTRTALLLLRGATARTVGGATGVVGAGRLLGWRLTIHGRSGATGRKGEKGGGAIRRRLADGEFLKEKLIAGLKERGERMSVVEMNTYVGELLVEVADDVEDERAVRDVLAEATESIDHGLEVAAVLGDGEVALDKSAKLGVEEDHTLFTIVKELRLDGEPNDACSSAGLQYSLHKIVGDRPVNPGTNDAIHMIPVGKDHDGGIALDVVLQGELPDGEEKLLAPTGVIVGGQVEDGRDEQPDVVDGDNLGVKMKKGRGFMHPQGVGVGRGVGGVRPLVVAVLDARSLGASGLGNRLARSSGAGHGVADPLICGSAVLNCEGGLIFSSLDALQEGIAFL